MCADSDYRLAAKSTSVDLRLALPILRDDYSSRTNRTNGKLQQCFMSVVIVDIVVIWCETDAEN